MTDDGGGTERTVLGCRNPCKALGALRTPDKNPYAFAVGEPVTYVQAPKAKGYRNRALPVFELPDHGL